MEKNVEVVPNTTADDNDNARIDDFLEDLPPSDRKRFERTFIQESFAMIGQMSQESEISKKITPEHIAEFLDTAKEDMKKGYQERREGKVLVFALVFVALIFFAFIIVTLKDNPEVMEKIIYAVAGLVAGAFGGYGYGFSKGRTDRD